MPDTKYLAKRKSIDYHLSLDNLSIAQPVNFRNKILYFFAKGGNYMKMNEEGKILIFRPYRRDKSGKIIYARSYGFKVFPMWVYPDEVNKY